jgi:hypothetical protein
MIVNKQKLFISLGVSSIMWLTLALPALALEEINLEDLKKQYPACKEGKTWNDCFTESINSSTEAKKTEIGLFKAGILWTGNIYEFGQLAGVCLERKCENLPQCEFSVFTQQYECRNGDKFWGFEFDSQDNKQGSGTYVWSDGNKYEGEMKDNDLHGKGKIEYQDGSVYTGGFENALKHGFGIYKSSEGWVYKGEYKEGMFSGQGEFTFENGERYVGEFLNGNFNGYGVYYYSDGTKEAGRWVNGEYVGQ